MFSLDQINSNRNNFRHLLLIFPQCAMFRGKPIFTNNENRLLKIFVISPSFFRYFQYTNIWKTNYIYIYYSSSNPFNNDVNFIPHFFQVETSNKSHPKTQLDQLHRRSQCFRSLQHDVMTIQSAEG